MYRLLVQLSVSLVALLFLLSCSAHKTHATGPSARSLPDEVYLIGHRGAAGLAPENTLAGFRRACEIGVDGIELDVLMTSDRHIVVHHDYALKPEIARTADGRWIGNFSQLIVKDLSLAELLKYDVGRLQAGTRYARRYPESQPADGERIPTLLQVIELLKLSCPPATQLWIEIKTTPEKPDLTPPPEVVADAVVRCVRDHKIAEQAYILSFDWRALAHVQKIAPEIPTVYLSLVGRSLNNIKPGQPGASAWTAGIDIDDYNGSIPHAVKASGGRYWAQYYKHLTRDDLKAARDLGIRVFVWTVDSKSEMKRLIDLGVDGIITNRPDIFKSIQNASQ
jgi:glycerophosphoryl diester phosphodiesterase